jgi:hypothetical protein
VIIRNLGFAFSTTAPRTLANREPWTVCHVPGTDDDEGGGLRQHALTHIVEHSETQAGGEVREGANVERETNSVCGISPLGIGGVGIGYACGRGSSTLPAWGQYRAIGSVFILVCRR